MHQTFIFDFVSDVGISSLSLSLFRLFNLMLGCCQLSSIMPGWRDATGFIDARVAGCYWLYF
jgi:hypothetical protein